MNQQDFISTYGPFANDIASKTGLDASVVLGQLANESGWGDHFVGNNPFGISPNGKLANYPSVADSGNAYVATMTAPRYQHIASLNAEDQPRAIAQAGYATDPAYGTKVAQATKTVKDAGFNAPSVEDLSKKLDAAFPDTTSAPAAPTVQAPSADELSKKLDAAFPETIQTRNKDDLFKPTQPNTVMQNVEAGLFSGIKGISNPVDISPALDTIRNKLYQSRGLTPPAPGSAIPPWQQWGLATPETAPPQTTSDRVIQGTASMLPGALTLYGSGPMTVGGLFRNALVPSLGAGVLGEASRQAATNAWGPEAAPAAQFVGSLVGGSLGLPGTVENITRPTEPPVPPSPLVKPSLPPSGQGPSPQGATPTASTVGAMATPPGQIPPLTAGQKFASESKAVMETASDRANNGTTNNETYVSGVERPYAARVVDPTNSYFEKQFRAADPQFRAQLDTVENNAKSVLLSKFQDVAGDPIALENAINARNEIKPDFSNAEPVDVQPIVDGIDQTLAGPAGKRSAVISVLNKVKASLYDANGNLEIDPEVIYGARKNLTDMLDDANDSAARAAKRELLNVRDQLDQTIESGAPGYGKFRADWAQASQPINKMALLQKYLTGPGRIVDASGNIAYGPFQKMLERILADRNPNASPTALAKDIADPDFETLIAIRNELSQFHARDEAARVKGSDTYQNFMNANQTPTLKGPGLVSEAGTAAAHYTANALATGVGLPPGAANAALIGGRIVKQAITAKRTARAAQEAADRIAAAKRQLLNTDPTQDFAP